MALNPECGQLKSFLISASPAWQPAKIMQPALFIAGDRDAVIARNKAALDRMPQTVPNLRKLVMVPGRGHWTQQERPAEVNVDLLALLKGLG